MYRALCVMRHVQEIGMGSKIGSAALPSISSLHLTRAAATVASDRPFDIVLWGCTGFTGKLVAEYLSKRSKTTPFRWALVGRNKERVLAVQQQLREEGHACTDDIFVSSPEDQASVDNVVGSARVVLCTTGPFIKCATPVVDACVRLGTDYVDITGETPYVRSLIDKYHTAAVNKGVYIVNMCGFDSIPSDLGVWHVVNALKAQYGEATERVNGYVTMKGQLSGGTVATGIALELMGPEILAQTKDPYLLGGPKSRPASDDITTALYAKETQTWTAPFMMAPINTRVVRRSAMLYENINQPYSPNFTYSESMTATSERMAEKLAAPMPLAPQRAGMVDAGRLPKPGEGPPKKVREKSHFSFVLLGTGTKGHKATCVIKGGDPGYDETAKMVSESALVLAKDRASIPPNRTGVVTPAFALGRLLSDRLKAQGITIVTSQKKE